MAKKGVFDISPAMLIAVFFTFIIILVAVYFGSTVLSLFKTHEASCNNEVEWKKLVPIFKNLEKDSSEETIFFYNEECNLASFSPSLSLESHEIKPNFNPGTLPRICLCKIEDNICKPYDCYKFKNFNEIKFEDKQFTTYNKADYSFIKFIKEEKTLRIVAAMSEKEISKLSRSDGGERPLNIIDTIVLHHTGGKTAESAIETLEERKLSVHYILDKGGALTQLIPDNFIAFHVKGSKDEISNNERSIGIEIVNTGKSNDEYTEQQYATLRKLLRELSKKYKILYDAEHIKGHYEMPGNKDKWDPSPNFDWSKIGINKNFSKEVCEAHNLKEQGYNCEELIA